MRRLEDVAEIAYASGFIEGAEGAIGTLTQPGFFTMLSLLFGAHPQLHIGSNGDFGGHGLVTSDVCVPGIPQSVATTL